MLHLVKVSLPLKRIAEEKIRDNYSWHQKVWDCFAHLPELQGRGQLPETDKGRTPFLSRYLQKSMGVELLLLSEYEPERPLWCPQAEWHKTELSSDYLAQSTYLFDLYANPTKNIKKTDGKGGYTKNGKRVTLMSVEDQRQWFDRKAQTGGFRIAEEIPLRIEKPVNHRFSRKGDKGLHIGVRFQGGLRVLDPVRFQECFTNGIGTAKSFGFGMLLIKPTQF